MTSHSKAGWRRLTKTHGAFENIPTLRVAGKDVHSDNLSSRKVVTPKKPIQYADPTLFPGRRLDRRQQSTYSAMSGTSGMSGTDQITLPGSGLVRPTGSTTGSTKLSHTSLPTMGANRPLLPDGSDPWGSVKQLREDSPIRLMRRQAVSVAPAAEEEGKVSSASAAAATLPPQSSFTKVSRWQQANFTHVAQRNVPVSDEIREALQASPDSMESHVSELVVADDHELLPQHGLWHQEEEDEDNDEELSLQQEPYKKQQEDEPTSRRVTGGRYTPPPFNVGSALPPHPPRGLRHVNPHRRPPETPTVSPTPPPGSGPRLHKILWALAPDEHANMSEAGLSLMQSTCQDNCATAEKIKPRTLHKTVTVTDLEVASDISCEVPETPRNPQLTQQLLLDHNQSASWSRDDRIYQWLAECDKETTSQSLPTHLPDIKYTFKYLKSVT